MRKTLLLLICLLISLTYPANTFALNINETNAREFRDKQFYYLEKQNNTRDSFTQLAAVIDVGNEDDLDGKNPLIAMALSFFIPGAGQIYNGEILKGIALFGVIIALGLIELLAVEPILATAEKEKKPNSLIEIAALVGRIGIPVLWIYSWGSAYQSGDPIYQRKKREEELKKKKEKNQQPVTNRFEIKLFTYKF